MNTKSFSKTKGQIIVLFALGLLALIALAALVLDGGMLFLNRRTAQAAADAGALAGARALCYEGSEETAINTAIQFATTENGGSTATAFIDADSGDIVVDVTMNQSSFFARVFNIDTLNVPATASANCFPPGSARNVIPVAWACRAPVGGLGDSDDCTILTLDWETEMQPLIRSHFMGETGPVLIHGEWVDRDPFVFTGRNGDITDQIYVIMDSEKLAGDMYENCMPNGPINCDFDGDGIPNISAGGDRSWLALEEGKGAAFLEEWLQNGLATPLNVHTWLAGVSGDKNKVFKAVQRYVMATSTNPYKFAVIPVFDDYCIEDPMDETSVCYERVHPEDTRVFNGSNENYFHVIAFAAFYVTCVDDGGQVECPGARAANLPGSAKSVEGYFVSGAPVTFGPGGTGDYDIGVYVVSLTR